MYRVCDEFCLFEEALEMPWKSPSAVAGFSFATRFVAAGFSFATPFVAAGFFFAILRVSFRAFKDSLMQIRNSF